MTGIGDTRNLTVRGVTIGTQRVSAVYVLRWEMNQTPANQFNLTVQVG